MTKRPCAYLMPLGRGISVEGVPTADTMRRAETTAKYYWENPSDVRRIVCSGGYSKSMKIAPPEGKREARSMADYLVAEAGIPGNKVEAEVWSDDTFYNFTSVVEGGYFDDAEINPDHPLGLVTGLSHGVRARLIARQAFGLSRDAVRVIRSPEEDSMRRMAIELGGAMIVRAALLGAEPGNIQDTKLAAERFEDTLGMARQLPMLRGV